MELTIIIISILPAAFEAFVRWSLVRKILAEKPKKAEFSSEKFNFKYER